MSLATQPLVPRTQKLGSSGQTYGLVLEEQVIHQLGQNGSQWGCLGADS